MFRSPRLSPASLEATLRTLPDHASVFVLDGAWLVVGPGGLFVLTEDDGDITASSRRAAARADAVRLELSDQLFWVPFVDAMCVTHAADFDPDQPCLVVPHDLVVATVSGGPVHIDADTLVKLRDLRYPRLR